MIVGIISYLANTSSAFGIGYRCDSWYCSSRIGAIFFENVVLQVAQTESLTVTLQVGSLKVINVAWKRGPNQFHGCCMSSSRRRSGRTELLQHDNASAETKSVRFGATGRVVLPELYDGKDKLFRMSYEDLQTRQAVTSTASVPTLKERTSETT